MAQLLIPGAIQVSIKMECSGQDVVNVIGLSGDNFTDPNAAVAVVKAAWEKASGPMAIRSNLVRVVSYRAVVLSPVGSVAELGSSSVGGNTTVGISTMAAAALIGIGGATRNRSSRGRMYHGPIGEAQIDPDGRTLLTATRTQLTSVYTVFRNDLSAGGYPWVVLSRKNSTFTPVGEIAVSSIIATQRRRLR